MCFLVCRDLAGDERVLSPAAVDGRRHHRGCSANHVSSSGPLVQSCPDPAVYGVVQSGDHVGRTCLVKWFKLRPSGDDVEVSVRRFPRGELWGPGVGP